MGTYETDDEIYRVDAVWLGPPKLTFPWRARYVAWGLGLPLTLGVFALLRMWWSVGVFTIAWSVLLAVALTRWLGTKITADRPLTAAAAFAVRELTTPRPPTQGERGAAAAGGVDVRPAPRGPRRRSRSRSDAQEESTSA